MSRLNLKKLKKSISDTEAMIQSLNDVQFWIPLNYDDDGLFVLNVVNPDTLNTYAPVFTSPGEIGEEYIKQYSIEEVNMNFIRNCASDECDGIVINPFTDNVIVPIIYLHPEGLYSECKES